MGVLMGVIMTLETLRVLELGNHWLDSLQIEFNGTVLACKCATSWSCAHQGHMSVPRGIISIFVTLRTLELSNHLVDSLQIKLIGMVSACRCATPWSFAHWDHMGVSWV